MEKFDTMLHSMTIQAMVPAQAFCPHDTSVIERHSDMMRLWYKNAEQVKAYSLYEIDCCRYGNCMTSMP